MTRPPWTDASGPVASRQSDERLGAVLVPNLGVRYSGVTSVIRTTLPHLHRLVSTDLVGLPAGGLRRTLTMKRFLSGFSPPSGKPFRVWHARRNVEMVLGLALRVMLHWPLRVVFTSAAQRRHTRFTRWLMRHVDAIITPTREAAGFLDGPSVLIPHGVDCDLFQPAPDRPTAWAANGLGGRFGIGIFGRIRHQKGTDLFIDALLSVLPRHPDFVGVVVGLCKADAQAFLGALKRKVAAAGLSDRIHFVGEVPPESLPGWLASVSICVAPQRREGFGLVPLEAAASGTPVVAARAGAAELIVDDGATGLLVPAGDAPALATAIDRLMRDADLREAMGSAARQRALADFSIAREVDRYLDVYQELWAAEHQGARGGRTGMAGASKFEP